MEPSTHSAATAAVDGVGHPTAPRARRPGLDAARALAVGAMVIGHTLDAVLDSALRSQPGIVLYWQFRSTTAPLFLLVAGYALLVSAGRHSHGSRALLRRYLPRVALLFGLGAFLRLPLWGLWDLARGDRTVWGHFLSFDALHCIASGLLVTVGLLAWTSSRTRRTALLVGLALLTVLAAPAVHRLLSVPEAPLLLQQTLGGGTPTFPLLPWSAFFFLGALLGLWFPEATSSRANGLWVFAAGMAVAAAAFALGSSQAAPTHPLYFVQRLGMGLLALGFVTQLPLRVQQWMAPWGRSSLWVYVLHLPIVYGWGFWNGLDRLVGPRLPFFPAFGMGLGLLGLSLLAVRLGRELRPLPARRPPSTAST